MKRFLLTLALVAMTGTAASAQVTGPLARPPAQTGSTSRLLFNAMLATAKAAASNPAAAQAARINYQAAIEQYHTGNYAAARASAIAALNAAGAGTAAAATPAQPMKPYTAPYFPQSVYAPGATEAAGTGPQPSRVQPMQPYTAPYVPQSVSVPGTIASINADAFIAEARSSVNACIAAKSPAAPLAQQRLATAERDNAAGQYGKVVASAQSIVDLCAAAQTSSP